MKRRLLERNREYESLRRRERRLHTDVFERDERIQQMSLTITDLEAALTDRVAEIRELESQNDIAMQEVNSVRRGERTREVVGRVFADSLSLVRGHDAREAKREAYANSPDVERSLSTPSSDDMRNLADGGTVDLTLKKLNFRKVWMLMGHVRHHLVAVEILLSLMKSQRTPMSD